jgi:hypothetical protein
VKPGPTYPDAARAYRADLDRWEPIIDRVADLFLRIQRTQQAEVAATVRFAAQELAKESGRKPSEVDVLHEVMHWKRRR